MEAKSSVLFPQRPPVGPYRHSDKSGPFTQISFFKIRINTTFPRLFESKCFTDLNSTEKQN